MQTKFLVMMGPSGVGKNTIMHQLTELDGRFVQIKPHVTRELRPGETDRVRVPIERLEGMRRNGEATKVNRIYGSYYSALPKRDIDGALTGERFPMVDYKVSLLLSDLEIEYPKRLFRVYLLPPEFEQLNKRLEGAGRKADPVRSEEDRLELENLDRDYGGLIDFRIVNEEGKEREVAEEIRRQYLAALRS